MNAARHIAVWIAAIVFFVLGAIWYTVLSARWLAAIGKTMEQITAEQGGSPLPYVIGFVAILVMCYALSWFEIPCRTAGCAQPTRYFIPTPSVWRTGMPAGSKFSRQNTLMPRCSGVTRLRWNG